MFIAADSRLLQAFWPFGPQKSRATNMQIDNTIHMFCFFVLNLCQQLKKMKQQDPRDGDGEILRV
jgi:hypothetical protein